MANNKESRFSTVDEYIAFQPPKVRPLLTKLRQTIKKAAPKAEERISYQMPGYWFHGALVWFAAFNNHYAFYMRPRVLQAFKEDLKTIETTKSAIKFSFNKPVPVQLVTKMVKYGASGNLRDTQLKNKIKSKKD